MFSLDMRHVVLVAEVRKKVAREVQAKDLFDGPWFTTARSYVESLDLPWAILSTRYGLLDPEQMTSWYGESLENFGFRDRQAWAEQASRLIHLGAGAKVTILAGQVFREYLEPILQARGMEIDVPLKGISGGQQKRWLQEHTKIAWKA
jgi:hypothetical protein